MTWHGGGREEASCSAHVQKLELERLVLKISELLVQVELKLFSSSINYMDFFLHNSK